MDTRDTLTPRQAAGYGLALVALILLALGFADKIDRDADEAIAWRKFVADSCLPSRPGESSHAVMEGTKLRCTVYARDARGFTPLVVSSAVMDVPQ